MCQMLIWTLFLDYEDSMTTIDHLLTFSNEAAALGVLTPMGFAPSGRWDRSYVDPGVRLITADPVWDTTDPDNHILVSPEEIISGFHITIALPEVSAALEALGPQKFLRVIEDRGLATAASKFHEYAVSTVGLPEGVATEMPAAQLNRVGGVIENVTFKISPRFLGSDYPATIGG